MLILIMKNMANNTMYTVQELHIFHNRLKYYYKPFHFHRYFHCILQLAYQLVFFGIYNSYSLNTLQHHINLSNSHSQLLRLKINLLSHLPLSINSLHSHLHLQVSCHFVCVVSLDWILWRLCLKTTSGTHNFSNGSLILFQLPLHLFTSIL